MLVAVLLATTHAVSFRGLGLQLAKLENWTPQNGSKVAGSEHFDEMGALDDESFLATLESDEDELADKDEYLPPGPPPDWDEYLTFVHVGKCAGSSVREFLSSNHLKDNHVHTRPLNSKDLGHRWFTTILVPIRDPIKRTISAFNWRHPSTEGIARRSSLEIYLYRCYDTVNAFAEGLDPQTNPETSSDLHNISEDESGWQSYCGQIARQAIDYHGGSGHMGMGYEFYFQHVLDDLASRDVSVVRVDKDHFEPDLREFLLSNHLPMVNSDVPHKKSNETQEYPKRGDTYLSDKGYAALRNALQNEYKIYHALEARR